MQTKTGQPIEIKSIDGEGRFSGYASVFNNVDNGRDVILPGAFRKVRQAPDGRLKIALNHDLDRIIGLATYEQDDYGLHVEGEIFMGVSYARDAYELMKAGALDSMSIGFNITESYHEKRDGRRVQVIKSVDLWEASVVPFGMNEAARVNEVKSDFRYSIRDWEHALRDLGLSQKEAKTVASLTYKHIRREGEDPTEMVDSSTAEQLKAELERIYMKHFKGESNDDRSR